MRLLSTNRILSLLITSTNLVYGIPIEAERAQEQVLPRNLEGEFGISKEFDYVIVGGGTAGLTLANRLSKDPSISVAVVEAGSFYQITNPVLGKTPVGDVLFVGSDPKDTNPLVDWNFVTEPQQGANGRKIVR
ncbi:putative GMC oxidoreductase [Cercophora samala]|uniref:GMC oxidoreductase n=1 Tax=Cercophora samala TaxID=330535 RepID=A0AA39ZK33_9PEZI|nr:putative GMC oxidoreductase [Cercophora samala]